MSLGFVKLFMTLIIPVRNRQEELPNFNHKIEVTNEPISQRKLFQHNNEIHFFNL